MSDSDHDDGHTARERRITELQKTVDGAGSEDDVRRCQRELERISLMTDEAFELEGAPTAPRDDT